MATLNALHQKVLEAERDLAALDGARVMSYERRNDKEYTHVVDCIFARRRNAREAVDAAWAKYFAHGGKPRDGVG